MAKAKKKSVSKKKPAKKKASQKVSKKKLNLPTYKVSSLKKDKKSWKIEELIGLNVYERKGDTSPIGTISAIGMSGILIDLPIDESHPDQQDLPFDSDGDEDFGDELDE